MRYSDNSLRDFKSGWSSGSAPKRAGKGWHWALLGTVSGLLLGFFSLTSYDANALRIKELPLDVPAGGSAASDIRERSDSLCPHRTCR